jgi:hypothetical protein
MEINITGTPLSDKLLYLFIEAKPPDTRTGHNPIVLSQKNALSINNYKNKLKVKSTRTKR